MTLGYVGSPILLAALLLAALVPAYLALSSRDRGMRLSFWLAWPHLGLAALSAALTINDPIDQVSCMFAIFGSGSSLIFAALDGLNLIRWLIQEARESGSWLSLERAVYVILRLALHAALIGAFTWCMLLCTV